MTDSHTHALSNQTVFDRALLLVNDNRHKNDSTTRGTLFFCNLSDYAEGLRVLNAENPEMFARYAEAAHAAEAMKQLTCHAGMIENPNYRKLAIHSDIMMVNMPPDRDMKLARQVPLFGVPLPDHAYSMLHHGGARLLDNTTLEAQNVAHVLPRQDINQVLAARIAQLDAKGFCR